MRIHFLTTDQKIADETAHFLKEWESDQDFILQSTSGSTGSPKTIKIEKEKMIASARMTGDFFNLSKGKKALLCISPSYIGGKMMIVRSLLYEMELYATMISSKPLQNLNEPIDFAAMVPLQVSETIENQPEKLNLIKHLIIGGAPVSRKLAEALQQFNCNAYSTYGMTETVSHIALKNLGGQEQAFKGIGNTTFETKNGSLVIHSPELEIESLETNDIVKLENEKEFHWLGRSDFTINTAGVKVQPEMIEDKLSLILPKDSFIISSIPDEKLGSKVILIAEEKIKALIDPSIFVDYLDRYEIPREEFFVEELVKTASGKVDRISTTQLLDGI